MILILLLKLCLAQDYPPYLVSPQDNEFSRTLKQQNEKSLFSNDWKNNFDNNVIIPDAYVFDFCLFYFILKINEFIIFAFFRNYFVVASRMVRPGQVYRVSVTVYKAKQPISVRASIQRNGVELASDMSVIKEGIPESLLLLVSINIMFTVYVYIL